MAHLSKHPDYSLNTVNPGRCFITNVPKDKEEEFIVRCGNIDMERGWVEIGPRGIAELAAFIGWIHPDRANRLEAENELLKSQLAEAQEKVDEGTLERLAEMGARYDAARKRADRYGKKLEEYEKRLGKEAPPQRKPGGRK